MSPVAVKTWAVSCTQWPDHESIVAAPTAGAAKYRKWLDIKECWEDTPITSMRARRVREYVEPAGFRSCVDGRGIAFARIGMRVQLSDGTSGRIVGHNSSANLDVLVGRVVYNVHPLWRVTYFDEGGEVIQMPPRAAACQPASEA